jgi:IS30 family transposase
VLKLSLDRRRAALDLLAAGHNPLQVARLSGVSKSYCYRLHHSVGGVYRPADVSYSDRYLSRDERYEIARLKDAGLSLRSIAVRLGRSPATISRELRRNADPRTGYQPERAHTLAWQRQRRPKPSKISRDDQLRAEVQAMLDKRYSPDQICGRLKVSHPDNERMRISHESIYRSIYIYPRGELKRELKASLRSGRATRRPRGSRKSDHGGRLRDTVSIHDRPDDVESRLIPGHHEGDLIKGTVASNSAVGTIVERTTGYLTLLHLVQGHRAEHVADAVIQQMSTLPDWFAKTLTWDRGTEMAEHTKISDTGLQVYFADPYSPWQRGSNENINGLLREYLPKGTDLSVHSAADLAQIADELNDRPRKRLGYHTPRERYAELLNEHLQPVATTP